MKVIFNSILPTCGCRCSHPSESILLYPEDQMSILNHDSRRASEPQILSPGETTSRKPPGMMASFPVTSTLIGMNLAVFAVMVLSGVSAMRPEVGQLRIWGADYGPLTLGGQPWRLITSVFVHVGLI